MRTNLKVDVMLFVCFFLSNSTQIPSLQACIIRYVELLVYILLKLINCERNGNLTRILAACILVCKERRYKNTTVQTPYTAFFYITLT